MEAQSLRPIHSYVWNPFQSLIERFFFKYRHELIFIYDFIVNLSYLIKNNKYVSIWSEKSIFTIYLCFCK